MIRRRFLSPVIRKIWWKTTITNTAKLSIKVALDVTCEKCSHSYIIEKIFTETVSRGGTTNAFMEDFTVESIGQNTIRGLEARILRFSEGSSSDFLDKRCPECNYLQSWMRGSRSCRWAYAITPLIFLGTFLLLRSYLGTGINLLVAGVLSLVFMPVVSEWLKRLYGRSDQEGRYRPSSPRIRILDHG